jgi:hypothetical protein
MTQRYVQRESNHRDDAHSPKSTMKHLKVRQARTIGS